jgi:hypothetical protein
MLREAKHLRIAQSQTLHARTGVSFEWRNG